MKKSVVGLVLVLALSQNVSMCASSGEYTLRQEPWLERILESEDDVVPRYPITPDNVYAELEHVYRNADFKDYIGEGVSQLDHALQAANHALQRMVLGSDSPVRLTEEHVIAALFHDAGQLFGNQTKADMDGYGVVEHEKIGAALLLTRGFSNKVTAMVAGHVDAKRYLVYQDCRYALALSDASRKTLALQGGPFSKVEADAFEKHPYFKDILFIRQCDESAKKLGTSTQPFSYYKHMIIYHLTQGQRH